MNIEIYVSNPPHPGTRKNDGREDFITMQTLHKLLNEGLVVCLQDEDLDNYYYYFSKKHGRVDCKNTGHKLLQLVNNLPNLTSKSSIRAPKCTMYSNDILIETMTLAEAQLEYGDQL